jgi:HlyD family secretion protein
VEVGHRNPLEAEILSGLQQGEEVVLHPSNELKDGMRIAPRSR